LKEFLQKHPSEKLKKRFPIEEGENLCGIKYYYVKKNEKDVLINMTFYDFKLAEIMYIKFLDPYFDLKTLADKFVEYYGKPTNADINTEMAHLVYHSKEGIEHEMSIWISYGKSGLLSPPEYGIHPEKKYYYCIHLKSKYLNNWKKTSENCIKKLNVSKTKNIDIPK
jgi:hypothetical protein